MRRSVRLDEAPWQLRRGSVQLERPGDGRSCTLQPLRRHAGRTGLLGPACAGTADANGVCMTPDYAAGLVLSVLLLAYLAYALILPERF